MSEPIAKPYWWANELRVFLEKLPDPAHRQWSAEDKRKWMDALSKTLDVLVVVSDAPRPAAGKDETCQK